MKDRNKGAPDSRRLIMKRTKPVPFAAEKGDKPSGNTPLFWGARMHGHVNAAVCVNVCANAVWRSGQRVDFMDKVDERVQNVANRAISSQCDLLYWQVCGQHKPCMTGGAPTFYVHVCARSSSLLPLSFLGLFLVLHVLILCLSCISALHLFSASAAVSCAPDLQQRGYIPTYYAIR